MSVHGQDRNGLQVEGGVMVGTNIECIAYLSSEKEGKFTVEPFKEKRSLSANALYWKCVYQLAKALMISNPYCHNMLLRKYGTEEIIGGELVYVALPDTKETEYQVDEDEYTHLKPTTQRTKSKRWYLLLKPSHTFDTAEMSRLIDGVAEEMRQCGLVPPQDEEIEKAIERYERTHNVSR